MIIPDNLEERLAKYKESVGKSGYNLDIQSIEIRPTNVVFRDSKGFIIISLERRTYEKLIREE